MNILRYGFFGILLLAVMLSCSKEYSLENHIGITAHGSLQSDASGDCLPKTVEGAFLAGKTLSDNNLLQVDIDVSSVGSYKISTDTVNGYFFEASGVFSDKGINTIKLAGRGTPLTSGTNLFTIGFDSTLCLIEVSVLPPTAGGPAVFTLQGSPATCSNATVAGTYTKDLALNSSNKVNIEVNVTSIGTYNVATAVTNGIIFSGNGTLAGTGVQTITLNGSGTPAASGSFAVPISLGSSSCTFPVNVQSSSTPPPTSTYFWKFTESAFVYEGDVDALTTRFIPTVTPLGTLTILSFYGSTVSGDTLFNISVTDLGGGINNNETYNTSSSTNNPAIFQVTDFAGTLYEASASTTGASIIVKVTGHNTTTKTIDGTFSGTARNGAGVIKTISTGQFKVQYQ